MTWGTPELDPRPVLASCCFCGKRAPRSSAVLRLEGWQVRYDYPRRYRCPDCRRRHEPEAAA